MAKSQSLLGGSNQRTPFVTSTRVVVDGGACLNSGARAEDNESTSRSSLISTLSTRCGTLYRICQHSCIVSEFGVNSPVRYTQKQITGAKVAISSSDANIVHHYLKLGLCKLFLVHNFAVYVMNGVKIFTKY